MVQTIKETINVIGKIIDSAKKEVIISSGHLNSRCYATETIKTSIEKAKARGVRFSVLSGSIDPDNSTIVALLERDIFVASTPPVFHFVVADGKNLRFETEDMDTDGNTNNEIRYNDRVSGLYLRRKFMESLRKGGRHDNNSEQ